VATQTTVLCDGCDVPLNSGRHHMARWTTKAPGCQPHNTDYDLCLTCFQIANENMKADRWPSTIMEKVS
jgi:hypothetical protein